MNGKSIGEIAKEARAAGMSYGKYVASKSPARTIEQLRRDRAREVMMSPPNQSEYKTR